MAAPNLKNPTTINGKTARSNITGTSIVGVVTNGLFASRPANILLLATNEGVKTIKK